MEAFSSVKKRILYFCTQIIPKKPQWWWLNLWLHARSTILKVSAQVALPSVPSSRWLSSRRLLWFKAALLGQSAPSSRKKRSKMRRHNSYGMCVTTRHLSRCKNWLQWTLSSASQKLFLVSRVTTSPCRGKLWCSPYLRISPLLCRNRRSTCTIWAFRLPNC